MTYLLSLYSPTHDRPFSASDSSTVAALGQSQRPVYSVTRDGIIQVVSMETVRGGGNVLRRGVTVPPVFVAVVSSRRTSP